MDTARIRIDMKVSDEMNDFLLMEARSKKLSFEGLLVSYIQEHMLQEKAKREAQKPR